jgi:hypothetical protein
MPGTSPGMTINSIVCVVGELVPAIHVRRPVKTRAEARVPKLTRPKAAQQPIEREPALFVAVQRSGG